ncbi:potassium transporter [Planoprotostelium fungivorum]|uniref:Potassium transporter n=1 Tax=Planoprotostelium fungivorum TaxID=1890364 RepID=A0A2P6N3V7_9EUKA|nr:potassium transporter [Planoprotostelium fungivorum]
MPRNTLCYLITNTPGTQITLFPSAGARMRFALVMTQIKNILGVPTALYQVFGLVHPFHYSKDHNPDQEEKEEANKVLGAISLIIWSIMIHATIKYMALILTANNHGEGGTFSLCAILLKQDGLGARLKRSCRVIAIVGGSLIIGQGAISPAVKISKAISIVDPHKTLSPGVILLLTALAVIIIYQCNRFGADRFGIVIGPFVLMWFCFTGITGIIGITKAPMILRAFNPASAGYYLLHTFQNHDFVAVLNQIGHCFVAVAGMETIYADMGDFGARSVRICWFVLVLPCLIVSYLGIGGRLISEDASDLWDQVSLALLPGAGAARNIFIGISFIMLLLASQLGGVFATISQAVNLGLFPPVAITKTSGFMACVYLPQINQVLMIACLAVVLGFHSDDDGTITEIYSFAVALLMLTTTVLYSLVVVFVWGKKHSKKWWILLFPILILVIFSDIIFILGTGSVLTAEASGWPAMAIAAFFSFIMFSWLIGRVELQRWVNVQNASMTNIRFLRVSRQFRFRRMDLKESTEIGDASLVDRLKGDKTASLDRILETNSGIDLKTISRWEGMGVFVSTNMDKKEQVPECFASYLTFSRSAPRIVVFLRLENVKRPTVEEDQKLTVITHGRGCYSITSRYGYIENRPRITAIIELAQKYCGLPTHELTQYYIHAESIKVKGFNWKWLAIKAFAIMKDLFNDTRGAIRVSPHETMQVGKNGRGLDVRWCNLGHCQFCARKPSGSKSKEEPDRSKGMSQTCFFTLVVLLFAHVHAQGCKQMDDSGGNYFASNSRYSIWWQPCGTLNRPSNISQECLATPNAFICVMDNQDIGTYSASYDPLTSYFTVDRNFFSLNTNSTNNATITAVYTTKCLSISNQILQANTEEDIQISTSELKGLNSTETIQLVGEGFTCDHYLLANYTLSCTCRSNTSSQRLASLVIGEQQIVSFDFYFFQSNQTTLSRLPVAALRFLGQMNGSTLDIQLPPGVYNCSAFGPAILFSSPSGAVTLRGSTMGQTNLTNCQLDISGINTLYMYDIALVGGKDMYEPFLFMRGDVRTLSLVRCNVTQGKVKDTVVPFIYTTGVVGDLIFDKCYALTVDMPNVQTLKRYLIYNSVFFRVRGSQLINTDSCMLVTRNPQYYQGIQLYDIQNSTFFGKNGNYATYYPSACRGPFFISSVFTTFQLSHSTFTGTGPSVVVSLIGFVTIQNCYFSRMASDSSLISLSGSISATISDNQFILCLNPMNLNSGNAVTENNYFWACRAYDSTTDASGVGATGVNWISTNDTFVNFSGGPAVRITSAKSIQLYNLTLMEGSSDLGAIYTNGAQVNIQGFTCTKNSGVSGGCLYSDSGSDGSWISITDAEISENTADNFGASMYFNSALQSFTLSRFRMANNHGPFVGGRDGTYNISDGVFINNNGGFSGGCIQVASQASIGSLALTNVDMIGNKGLSGAAIFNAGNISSVLLVNCTFDGNVGVGGVGIYHTGNIRNFSMRDVIMKNQIADSSGGGIQITGPISVITSSGGAIYISTNCNVIQISDCVFSGNSGSIGGAVYLRNTQGQSNVTVTMLGDYYILMTDNHAIFNGAGAYMSGYNLLSLINWTNKRNTASQSGGVLYAENCASVYINNWTSDSNTAGLSGGTTYISTVFTLSVTSYNSANNTAELSGGTIWLGNIYNTSITDLSTTGNVAVVSGGALYVNHCRRMSVGGWKSDSNAAGASGGSLYVSGNLLLSVQRWTCANNTATTSGGCFHLSSTTQGSTNISSSLFFGNTSPNGAGGYISSSHLILFNNQWKSNVASQGGTLEVTGSGDLEIYNETFVENQNLRAHNNTAMSNGAALYFDGIKEQVEQLCTSPRAPEQKESTCPIVVTMGTQPQTVEELSMYQVVLDTCNFSSNHAEDSGGAIFIKTSSLTRQETATDLYVTSSMFSSNTADTGGALYIQGGKPYVKTTVFNDNHANNGSSIMLQSASLSTSNSEFLGENDISMSSDSVISGTQNSVQCPNHYTSSIQVDQITYCILIQKGIQSISQGAIAAIVICSVFFLLVLLLLLVLARRHHLHKKSKMMLEEEMQRLNLSDLILDDVTVQEIIGKGHFGEVYKGEWNETTVALKGLKNLNPEMETKWREEIHLLRRLNHPNVVRLLGVTHYNNQFLMVLEYVDKGSLDEYLKKSQKDLTDNHLIEMCFDIVKGMMYLQSRGVIHRDLAARNILINSMRHIKISDFGMSRENNVYEAKDKVMPVRWCAPETILYNVSTYKSDVWSFECLTTTFLQMHKSQPTLWKRKVLLTGHSEELFDVLCDCWEFDSERRPSFKDIYVQMREMYNNLPREHIHAVLVPVRSTQTVSITAPHYQDSIYGSQNHVDQSLYPDANMHYDNDV